ncbi:MAG: purine-nucleoside phosphorylase [Candidatus Edwardsbacteria bacterium]
MTELKKMIAETTEFLKKKTKIEPEIGIILGTGLGGLVKEIEAEVVVPYEEIPHFPLSTVEYHAGKLIFGKLSGKIVMAMQGRFHYYEGYTMQQITFPVRVMKVMGTEILIVSNACGGVNPVYESGDIMVIWDHINMLGNNPLIGPNDESLGPRFPDMFECYDRKLIALAEVVALEEKIKLQKGVYLAFTGPNLETAAEYRLARIMGADVVGMSTIPEVIVARHQGMRVLGFSIVTDMGLPDALKPIKIEEVLEIAHTAEPKLTRIIKRVVEKI